MKQVRGCVISADSVSPVDVQFDENISSDMKGRLGYRNNMHPRPILNRFDYITNVATDAVYCAE